MWLDTRNWGSPTIRIETCSRAFQQVKENEGNSENITKKIAVKKIEKSKGEKMANNKTRKKVVVIIIEVIIMKVYISTHQLKDK